MTNYEIDDRDQFAKDILIMLERGSLNDVKIKLSDGEIVANKDILMARSEYFATMFRNSKFLEGETSSVDMSHCSKAVMEKIIKFLLIGFVKYDDLSLKQILELSIMSEMMLLEKFHDQVEDYIKVDCALDIRENVHLFPEYISALKYAHQNNLSDIKNLIAMELLWHLSDIIDDANGLDTFKALPFLLIREIFKSDLNDRRDLPTSKQRHDYFMTWLSVNEATEDQKREIVGSFYFNDFTVEDLMTSIRDSGLYPTSKIDQRVLQLFKKQRELLEEKDKQIKAKNKLIMEKNKLLRISRDWDSEEEEWGISW